MLVGMATELALNVHTSVCMDCSKHHKIKKAKAKYVQQSLFANSASCFLLDELFQMWIDFEGAGRFQEIWQLVTCQSVNQSQQDGYLVVAFAHQGF